MKMVPEIAILLSHSFLLLGLLRFFDFCINLLKIWNCLETNLGNLLDVDRVLAFCAWLEGNNLEFGALVELYKKRGQDYVWQIITLWHVAKEFLNVLATHEPKWRIGVW